MFPAGSNHAGQRELTRFAGIGRRKQAMLDLSGQRQWDRALPPLKQIRETAVGNNDICERVRGQRNVSEALLVWLVSQQEFQHTDGFPAVGHWSEHPPTAALFVNADCLGSEHLTMRTRVQGHRLSDLCARNARRGAAVWLSRIRASPLKSAMRNATSDAANVSASSSATTSAAATGGAFSTAASRPPKSSLDLRRALITPAYATRSQ